VQINFLLQARTEHSSRDDITSASKSGDPGLDFRPGSRLAWQRLCVVSLILQENIGKYLKIDHYHFHIPLESSLIITL